MMYINDASRCTKEMLNIELLKVYLSGQECLLFLHPDPYEAVEETDLVAPQETGRQNHYLGIIRSLTMPLSVENKCYRIEL